MKIYIGPYTNWIGPYQIAEKLMFWIEKYENDEDDDRVHNFGTWLAEDRHGNDSWLTKICQWIDSKKKRKVKVRIDRYDTWNMDHTLSLIIVPMLKQLKESKHGSPFTDDGDVPESLRSTSARPLTEEEKNCGGTDEFHHDRWVWILGEMLWAFEQELDEDADNKFHSGTIDFVNTPVDHDGNLVDEKDAKLFRMDRSPNDTHTFDSEGYKKWQDRKSNGFRLFGKYYENLWD